MGYSQKTPHLGLPQFVESDKPSWLGDFNGAMGVIDRRYRQVYLALETIKLIAKRAMDAQVPDFEFQSHDVPSNGTTTLDVHKGINGYILDFGIVRGATTWDELASKPTLSDVATSGQYSDLLGRPELADVARTGSYGSLTDRPALKPLAESGDWSDVANKPTWHDVAYSGDYFDLDNRPTISAAGQSGNYADLNGKPSISTVGNTGQYADLLGKPALKTVATTGDYTDLTNRPTINPEVPWLTTLPTLAAGWSNTNTADYFGFNYMRTTSNDVILRGTITKGSGSTATIATLPSGMRPSKNMTFVIATAVGYATLGVNSNGSVVFGSGDASAWCSLDGVTFRPA